MDWCGTYTVDSSHVGLLLELDFSESLASADHVLVLDTHDTTSPLSHGLLVVVVLGLELGGESVQVLHVLLVDVSEGNASGGLHVAELAEGSLSAHEAEWDLLSAAESWQVDHALNWVNIVGHDDKSGLTLLNKSGNVVKTELEVHWLWTLVSLLGISSLEESLLLLGLGLWLVLGQKLEELTGCTSELD